MTDGRSESVVVYLVKVVALGTVLGIVLFVVYIGLAMLG